MKNKKTITIALTGGLGNQLFQLAAGLCLAEGGQVELMSKPGRPRLNKNHEPEIYSFELPRNVIPIRSGHSTWLLTKVIGFNLRSGISPNRIEKLTHFATKTVSRIVLFICSGKNRKIVVSDNIGFSSGIKLGRKNLLIGYFQTHNYIDELHSAKFVSNLISPDSEVVELQRIAKEEMPLVVHVRLGDYKNESEFGVLSRDYYLSNIKKLWGSGKYKKIWLFSDEPDVAINYFSNEMNNSLRIINANKFSSAETLTLMTFGHGYIIANSTFGWWGAFLSQTLNPEVVSPKPWFREMEEPNQLIPSNWLRAHGFPSQ